MQGSIHMILSELQPDQRFEAWDGHVSAYEAVFERSEEHTLNSSHG